VGSTLWEKDCPFTEEEVMPKKIGVFIDVSNIYYCVNKKYKGRKLDYKKYMDYIRSLGDITVANAYGAQVRNQAASFLYCLRQLGIEPKYSTPKSFTDNGAITKKADYDVKITVDIIEAAKELDILVLGSADSDFVPLLKSLTDLKIIVFACKISNDIAELGVTCIEIPESFMEEKHETPATKTG
jgi:uncharacterized LabA/DUF88 family protein